jgi:hypothetical protein
MQQPHLTTYADIAEVRTVTGAAACNQLLSEGSVLLGVYPVTTIGEMAEGTAGREQERQKQIQDMQRYVRGYCAMLLVGGRSSLFKKRLMDNDELLLGRPNKPKRDWRDWLETV